MLRRGILLGVMCLQSLFEILRRAYVKAISAVAIKKIEEIHDISVKDKKVRGPSGITPPFGGISLSSGYMPTRYAAVRRGSEPTRLACVRRTASVHSELGSNSSNRRIVQFTHRSSEERRWADQRSTGDRHHVANIRSGANPS